MNKVKEFISRIKLFLISHPKRTKFLGIIFVAVTLPLIIITALTVQNLKQKASVSDVVNITDSSGTPIESTATPNVFININLSASTQWKLPEQPSANSSLVKKAYAAGQSCVNMGANNCPTGEYCKYNSCDEESNCTGVCVSSGPQETAKPQGDYSQLPTATPAPLPAQALPKINAISPTPTPALDSCSKLNPTLYQCASSCNSLGEGWSQQTNWADISCPNAQQQCCYYRPILILKTVSIRNIDSDGTGGQVPANIAVNNAADIVRIPWKLNDLRPGQTEAQRTVLVNLIADSGQSVGFNATVNLINLNNKIPTISPVISPIKTGSESAVTQNSVPKSFDLNNDNTVNCKDTEIAAGQYGKQETNPSADFDNDGQVTEIDLNAILRNYTPGDSAKCE